MDNYIIIGGYVVSSSDILITVKEVTPWKRCVVFSPTMVSTTDVCMYVCVPMYRERDTQYDIRTYALLQ